MTNKLYNGTRLLFHRKRGSKYKPLFLINTNLSRKIPPNIMKQCSKDQYFFMYFNLLPKRKNTSRYCNDLPFEHKKTHPHCLQDKKKCRNKGSESLQQIERNSILYILFSVILLFGLLRKYLSSYKHKQTCTIKSSITLTIHVYSCQHTVHIKGISAQLIVSLEK